VIKKEAKKILKYKKLATEIQLMWNVKTQVIPVTIETTGSIPESFSKYLSNVPEKHEIEELQKTAILSTGHICR
jgi:mannosyltransferase OCH1-like enzyme